MSLPARVRVAGLEYAVIVEDSPHFERFGEIEFSALAIRITDRATEAMRPAVLLHEVLHAVDVAYDTDLTEHQVTALSRGLLAVLRDNPDLAAFLTAD